MICSINKIIFSKIFYLKITKIKMTNEEYVLHVLNNCTDTELTKTNDETFTVATSETQPQIKNNFTIPLRNDLFKNMLNDSRVKGN